MVLSLNALLQNLLIKSTATADAADRIQARLNSRAKTEVIFPTLPSEFSDWSDTAGYSRFGDLVIIQFAHLTGPQWQTTLYRLPEAFIPPGFWYQAPLWRSDGGIAKLSVFGKNTGDPGAVQIEIGAPDVHVEGYILLPAPADNSII